MVASARAGRTLHSRPERRHEIHGPDGGGTPLSLDGFYKGKSDKNMDDDWGYPYFLGNQYGCRVHCPYFPSQNGGDSREIVGLKHRD